MIRDHLEEWLGFPVKLYDPEEGVEDYKHTIYRIAVEYEDSRTAVGLLESFLEDPASTETQALIFGAWGEFDTTSEAIVDALIAAQTRLPKLRGLFLGDILSEENEISWINQSDLSALFPAFPELEHLRIRGNEGLKLGRVEHARLKSLIIETGGLSMEVVSDIQDSRLPALEHLELWLGSDSYGWDGAAEDFEPLLSGNLFPKLKYLGLRDSEIQDEIAMVVARSPLVGRLETLDLSLGTLSDEGGVALLTSAGVKSLRKLDLHHHFLSESMMARFKESGLPVDISDRQKPHEYNGEEHRYVSVSE